MKKLIATMLILAMVLTAFTACESDTNKPPAEKIRIVAAVFPQYDWVSEIIGDKTESFDLTLLVNSNIDMHSYQPSVTDIADISTADLFIYVGGHSDDWVEAALAQATNEDMVVINLVKELGDAILMENTDKILHEESSGCACAGCNSSNAEEEIHEEEHVWVSLRFSKILCEVIAEAIIALDPANESVYRANLSAYSEKLDDLDSRYTQMVEEASNNTLIFADRFPFLYLMNDYGLDYYAAFSGCSAANEITPNTIVNLAEKINQSDLAFVMVTETANRAIAETVVNSTESKDQEILVLNGMKVVESGENYLSVMESNLEVLRKALS
jgi:zinc transport system substrate-binding protein